MWICQVAPRHTGCRSRLAQDRPTGHPALCARQLRA